MASLASDRYAFLKMAAPASYVAGLGRGASGFTTRSDIGPAREGPSQETIDAAREARGEAVEEEVPEEYQDPENETGLFAGTVYEADDQEADNIYESVDAKMEERRRKRKEAREQAEADEYLRKNPRIQEQFSDLKRGLNEVSELEWENLPEPGNMTGKKRKMHARMTNDKQYVVPDSIILGARDRNIVQNSLDDQQMNGGYETPGQSEEEADFIEIGQAQKQVLSLKLDQRAKGDDGAVSGLSTSIDPKGYLTDLASQILKSDAEIGDAKRGRTLLSSLIKTNPKHGPGWIAAARLEEFDGKMVIARKIIDEGCKNCPRSEEVWREAARLNTPENAKIILANAVTNMPQSVNIWLDATELETELVAKKRVLRKALEYIPNSIKLWRKAVQLEENPEDARILLARAVEVVPSSIDLWLALARVETPEKAKAVLNKARKVIPTSHEIWIAAGRLVEQEESAERVDGIMASAVASLKKNGVELPREEWKTEAEKCEAAGSLATGRAIIKATIAQGLDEEDRLDTWLDDAASALARDRVETARAIFAFALRVYPNKANLWRKASELEQTRGSREAYLALLRSATRACPHVEEFWLRAAKEAWRGLHDVAAAREILESAFSANPESEQIWLAACTIEAEENNLDTARQLMNRARQVANTARIWIKSAVFERIHGTAEDALKAVEEGLGRFPDADKLYMIKGQIHEQMHREDPQAGHEAKARDAYSAGTRACKNSIPLWILASRLEEAAGQPTRARVLIERARHHNPRNAELWLEAIRIEQRQNSLPQAKALLAKAMQECPTSGSLWVEAIWVEARPQQKTKSTDALKKSNQDPAVIIAVARIFHEDRQLDKARKWYERGAASNTDLGDSWAWWLRFERQHGTPEQIEVLHRRCIEADPKHGAIWQSVSKDLANYALDVRQKLDKTVAKLPSKTGWEKR